MKLAICFAAIFLYKLVSNISGLLRTNYYQNKYQDFVSSKGGVNFTSYSHSVKRLFESANVPDAPLAVCKPAGYGHIMTGSASLFENMGYIGPDSVGMMINCFSKAYGTYRARIFESFSPLYWINSIIFLPKKLLEYIGLSGESIFVKIAQVIYWIATPSLIFFRNDIYNYIAALISNVK